MIEKARAGTYPEQHRAATCRRGGSQRFFTKTEAGYQIRQEVRDLCVFAKHDVTRDPPFSAMDLISCRNLMIYLGPALQDRVLAPAPLRAEGAGLPRPRDARRPSVPSPASRRSTEEQDLRAHVGGAAARVRLHAADASGRCPAAARPGAALPDRPGARGPRARPTCHREADRLVLAEFAPPGVVVTDDLAIVQFRGQDRAPSSSRRRARRASICFAWRAKSCGSRSVARSTRRGDAGPRAGDGRRAHRRTGTAQAWPLEVIPFAVHSTPQRFFVVLFEDVTPEDAGEGGPAATPAQGAELAAESALRQELASTREYLRVRHRAARGEQRGAQGGQRGDRLEQRGAPEHERGAPDGEGGARRRPTRSSAPSTTRCPSGTSRRRGSATISRTC